MQGTNPSQAVNLVPDVKLAEFDTPEAPPSTGGIVSWSPPQQNWNPWTSCNLDEGPLASVSGLAPSHFSGSVDTSDRTAVM